MTSLHLLIPNQQVLGSIPSAGSKPNNKLGGVVHASWRILVTAGHGTRLDLLARTQRLRQVVDLSGG